jgi:hypothetical protein
MDFTVLPERAEALRERRFAFDGDLGLDAARAQERNNPDLLIFELAAGSGEWCATGYGHNHVLRL